MLSFFFTLFSFLFGSLSSNPRLRAPRPRYISPRLEWLEGRIVPTDFLWTGDGGNTNWTTPKNWMISNETNKHTFPQAGDNVTIQAVDDEMKRLVVTGTQAADTVTMKGGGAVMTVKGTLDIKTSMLNEGQLTLSPVGKISIGMGTGILTNWGGIGFNGGGVVDANIVNNKSLSVTQAATIGGNLTNNAVISTGKGNIVAAINVQGDFTQNKDGTLILRFRKGPPMAVDRIDVTGTANLGGTLKIVGDGTRLGAKDVLVPITGTVKGQFNSMPGSIGANQGYTFGFDAQLKQFQLKPKMGALGPNQANTAVVSSTPTANVGQPVILTATVTGASGTPTGSVAFWAGTTELGEVALNGSGTATFSTAALPPGVNPITVVYEGDDNYDSSTSDVLNETVFAAAPSPTLLLTATGGTFNGQSYPATVLVAGSDEQPASALEGVSPTLDYQQLDSNGNVIADLGSSAPFAAGTYLVTASFAGSADYTSATATATFTIAPAMPSVNVWVPTSAYSGQPTVARTTVAGVVAGVDDSPASTLEGVGLTLDYQQIDDTGDLIDLGSSAPSAPGVYLVTATFAGSTDYTSSAAVDAFVILPAAPALTITDAGGAYNGQPFAATTTVAGVLQGVDDTPSSSLQGVAPTLDYQQLDANGDTIADLGSSAPTSAGTYQVSASFAGSTDYASVSTSTTFSIAQATPTLTVTDDGGTFNGQPFQATVLVAGVVAGVDDTPSASLEGVTPTEDYQQLDSSGDVLADLGSTTPTSAGTYQVSATFAGSTDYASVSVSTTFTIAQANPSVALNALDSTYNGQPFAALGLVEGVVPGVDQPFSTSLEGVAPTLDFQQVDSNDQTIADFGSAAPVQAGTYVVIASFPGSTDYASTTNSAFFTISQATPTVSVTNAGGTFNGQQFLATALVAGVVAGVDDSPSASLEGSTPSLDYQQVDANGDVIADLDATAPTQAGSYVVTASFAGSTDYLSGSVSTTFTISQATPTVTVTDAGGTYSGQAFAALAQVAGILAGVDDTPSASLEGVTPTLDYLELDANNQVMADLGAAPPTTVGSYEVIASFAGSSNYSSASADIDFTISPDGGDPS